MAETCEVCRLAEGDTSDGLDPLGSMTTCEWCGRWACPVCLCDGDCCFAEADDHDDDPDWAPRGWHRRPEDATGGALFERVGLPSPSSPTRSTGQ